MMSNKKNESIVKIIERVSISSILSIAVNIFSLVLVFIIHLTLTNYLGSEDYGLYYFIASLVMILSILTKGGIDTLLIKFLPKYSIENNPGLIKGLLSFTNRRVIINCIIIGLIFIISIFAINNYKHLDNFNDYLYFLILLPCISFLHINQAKLIGFKLPIKSQISEKLIFPIIFLVSISYLLHSEGLMLTVQIVLLCHTFSLITAMLAVEYFLTKLLKNKYINNKKESDTNYWKKSSRSFILITASYLILSHIDVLMIGILQDKEQSGIYAIASRIAALVAYGLYVSNIILMPYISSLYSEKRYLSLERILKKISRYNFIIAGLIFIIIYIFRYELLRLFGADFIGGENALIILCIAQVINVIAGSVGALMTMSGNEKYLSSVMLFSVLLNIIFNSILIPKMGIEGAAIATGLSIIFWNCILLIHANNKIGINPSIINIKRMKS